MQLLHCLLAYCHALCSCKSCLKYALIRQERSQNIIHRLASSKTNRVSPLGLFSCCTNVAFKTGILMKTTRNEKGSESKKKPSVGLMPHVSCRLYKTILPLRSILLTRLANQFELHSAQNCTRSILCKPLKRLP